MLSFVWSLRAWAVTQRLLGQAMPDGRLSLAHNMPLPKTAMQSTPLQLQLANNCHLPSPGVSSIASGIRRRVNNPSQLAVFDALCPGVLAMCPVCIDRAYMHLLLPGTMQTVIPMEISPFFYRRIAHLRPSTGRRSSGATSQSTQPWRSIRADEAGA